MSVKVITAVPKYEAKTAIGQVMQWATEPPVRSWTLFGSRMGVGRVARVAERLVFFGAVVVNLIWAIGGDNSWAIFAVDVAGMKIASVVVAQLTQVGTNMVRYVLDPAARDWIRATTPVEFKGIGGPVRPTVDPDSGRSMATSGIDGPQEYIKPGQIPASDTINVPSEDFGTPQR